MALHKSSRQNLFIVAIVVPFLLINNNGSSQSVRANKIMHPFLLWYLTGNNISFLPLSSDSSFFKTIVALLVGNFTGKAKGSYTEREHETVSGWVKNLLLVGDFRPKFCATRGCEGGPFHSSHLTTSGSSADDAANISVKKVEDRHQQKFLSSEPSIVSMCDSSEHISSLCIECEKHRV